jgi:glycosyltransferase involved in cell wall biosynthesis
MVCGLPAVATDIPGNREALGDHRDEQLCAAGDAGSLADKLLSLLRSPELRQELGARNRERALAAFSIEAMCRRMTAIISNALNGHRGQRQQTPVGSQHKKARQGIDG